MKRNHKGEAWSVLIIIFAAVVVIFSIICAVLEVSNKVTNERTVIATVTDKEVKRAGEDSDKYLVYTELDNGEVAVYEITDSLLKGRFDSSDLYAKIKIGETYKFTICGERIHFLSMYPNIYSAEIITTNTEDKE